MAGNFTYNLAFSTAPHTGATARSLLDFCLQYWFIHREDWQRIPETLRNEFGEETDVTHLLERLVEAKLLTRHQADRIAAGTTYGMLLGSYRVLDRLGAGGMGVIFLAEHIHLRRLAAIKILVLHDGSDSDGSLLKRFFNEIRVIAQLKHPNIVWALDTGEIAGEAPGAPMLYYHVMEYVPGKDLQLLVQTGGPLSLNYACDLIYQVASALVEANKHGLVHRDIKPPNILVTPEGQAKLLDFGSSRASVAQRRRKGRQGRILLPSVYFLGGLPARGRFGLV